VSDRIQFPAKTALAAACCLILAGRAIPTEEGRNSSDDTIVVLVNGKLYFDVGPLEPYLLAGVGLGLRF